MDRLAGYTFGGKHPSLNVPRCHYFPGRLGLALAPQLSSGDAESELEGSRCLHAGISGVDNCAMAVVWEKPENSRTRSGSGGLRLYMCYLALSVNSPSSCPPWVRGQETSGFVDLEMSSHVTSPGEDLSQCKVGGNPHIQAPC